MNNHLSEEKLPATQRSGGKAFQVGELQELRLQVGTCLMCWGSRKQWDTGESVGDEIKWHGDFLHGGHWGFSPCELNRTPLEALAKGET